jgi:uncharacterized 2Fe-2S/4Fe-4S cluster protein (DUF4445 family)
MSRTARVTFVETPAGGGARAVEVAAGRTLLDAAHDANVEITATCGRRGRCRSCRVKVLSGDLPPPTLQDTVQLGHEAVHERFRLSCQTEVVGDVTVMAAPPKTEAGHQILGGGAVGSRTAVAIDSGIRRHVITAEAPMDENHQTSDVEEILRHLPPETEPDVTLDVLRKVPGALRDKGGQMTVTTFNGRIIDLEAGDAPGTMYGMAFDIGTTSVVGSLIDLTTGAQMASVGALNPQTPYGGDLMSRIAFAQFDEKKLALLRGRILTAINGFIEEACEKAAVSGDRIYKIVIAGNTCMHHVFLGVDVSFVGLAPYAPTVRRAIVVAASELPLKRAPNAQVCLLPIVAGFVGADTIGAILATRIHETPGIRVLVDIGTNGEVVIGGKDRLMACSAPAGPAFEGGQIKHGMRGAVGAIEAVSIEDDVECDVIGDVAPLGICGSGLIDAVAKMLDAGVLDGGGRLRHEGLDGLPPKVRGRIVPDGKSRAFVLASKAVSAHGEDVTLTQMDIRQLQLAKGAIYSGILMLQRIMDVPDEKIDELLLAGGFGNYVSIDSAVRIRLLPPLAPERITYVGNAALRGAEMALVSEAERRSAETIARGIEHVALATRMEFQEIFVEACKLVPGLAAYSSAEKSPAGGRQSTA